MSLLLLWGYTGIAGALDSTEGADGVQMQGLVSGGQIAGALAVQEQLDAFAAAGTVQSPVVGGALNASEAADAFSAAGTVQSAVASGALVLVEGADAFSASSGGGVLVSPPPGAGAGRMRRRVRAVDPWLQERLAVAAKPAPAVGVLASTEAPDGIAATGRVFVVGRMACAEAADGVQLSGVVSWRHRHVQDEDAIFWALEAA